jgi:cellobiose-specific phosphotransferase system component IIA
MSISNTTMAAIQSAGQALSVAHTALAAAAQEQSARVAQAMASNPFGLENDSHFEHWKAIARMAQALEAMEGQMKTIFQTASEIALHAPALSPAPRAMAAPRLAARADLEPASDVTSRPAKTARRAPSVPKRKAAAKPAPVVALKGNAQQLMGYLSSRLDRRAYVRMTHGEIAAGASLPLGSVGAALNALMQKGLLLEGERGSYKLG